LPHTGLDGGDVDRVVLGRRENTMVRFRWTGAEPDGLSDDKLAEEFCAV
jgi:hypothetical protein